MLPINVPEVITIGILGEFSPDSYKYIRYALNTANTFSYDSTIGSKTIFNISNVSIQDPGNKKDVLIINDKKSFSEKRKTLLKITFRKVREFFFSLQKI